jgi:hypothetical protein
MNILIYIDDDEVEHDEQVEMVILVEVIIIEVIDEIEDEII